MDRRGAAGELRGKGSVSGADLGVAEGDGSCCSTVAASITSSGVRNSQRAVMQISSTRFVYRTREIEVREST